MLALLSMESFMLDCIQYDHARSSATSQRVCGKHGDLHTQGHPGCLFHAIMCSEIGAPVWCLKMARADSSCCPVTGGGSNVVLSRLLLAIVMLGGSIFFPLAPGVGLETTPSPDPLNVYGLANMHRWPDLRALLEDGANRQAIIAVVGDDWILNDRITGPLRIALQDEYGDAGAGYASVDPQHTPPAGVTISRAGIWTDVDQLPTAVGLDIAHSTAIDIVTPASVTITTTGSVLGIHYLIQPGGGKFRQQLDGRAMGFVDTDTLESSYIAVEFCSLEDKVHTLRIEVGAAGTAGVTLMGFDSQRLVRGVRVHKFGNGGLTAQQLVSVNARNWQRGLGMLHPDVVMVLVGTNDDAQDVSPTAFSASVLTLIDRIRAAVPAADIVLIAPGDNGLTPGAYRITDYVTALRTIAQDERITFYDILGRLGPYEEASAAGYYANSTDLSAAGGAVVAADLFDLIFRHE